MSTEQIKKPRGTIDYFNDDARLLSKLKEILMDKAIQYGCSECFVPIFEENKLFHRTTGESSDIVTKETFDLVQKGDKPYTLRPEFTAGVNRAVVENKFYSSPDMPLRLAYFGPVFRYERPQAGRLRQFNQYGVEFLDTVIDFDCELDCFLLSLRACEAVLSKPIKVKLNYLGSLESRENFKKELKAYFQPFIGQMCDDCKRRYEVNPLRILDCKVEDDKAICRHAPKIQDYLTQEDKDLYNRLISSLTTLGIDFEVDDELVRGLDYYTGLVWELYDKENENIGAIGGGGKYTNLMSEIGGPQFEGIGFSLGVERLILALDEEKKAQLSKKEELDVFVIDNRRDGTALKLSDEIRKLDKSVNIASFSRGMKGAFKMADRLFSKYVLIVDQDCLQLKDMSNREQKVVTEEELLSILKGEN